MKKDWTPTESAFQHFLEWLDEGVDSGGEKYLEMRRRLIAYFDRKNCLSADELADETLSRVAQKVQEKGGIKDLAPAHYCYVTAKFVFLEYLRRHAQGNIGLDDLPAASQPRSEDHDISLFSSDSKNQEQLLDCLDQCLKKLSATDSQLILEYYQGEQQEKIQHRRKLGERLGLSANALSVKACRIRGKVEACVKECCGKK